MALFSPCFWRQRKDSIIIMRISLSFLSSRKFELSLGLHDLFPICMSLKCFVQLLFFLYIFVNLLLSILSKKDIQIIWLFVFNYVEDFEIINVDNG